MHLGFQIDLEPHPHRLPGRRLAVDGDEFGAGRERERVQNSLGSGVIVAAQGFILTNNHVVEGADEIAVMLPGGKVAEARVVGTDPETDLAVLRVDAKGLQPITFADPASVPAEWQRWFAEHGARTDVAHGPVIASVFVGL